jgi:DNA-binding CsgD family transcriptional regulator
VTTNGKVYVTATEHKVLLQLVNGLTDPEIGERLFVTRETVKTHLRRMNQRFGTHNRLQLVQYAQREGLIPPVTGMELVLLHNALDRSLALITNLMNRLPPTLEQAQVTAEAIRQARAALGRREAP